MLGLIKMYYTGKTARVCVEGSLSDAFSLATGLGQGCVLALLLFNIFLAAVMEAWKQESGGGVNWFTRIDGALLHRELRDKYASWQDLQTEDLGYANDAALLADTLTSLHQSAQNFQQHLNAWGSEPSVGKTEAMSTQSGYMTLFKFRS